jgi:Uma2 family endonuclease
MGWSSLDPKPPAWEPLTMSTVERPTIGVLPPLEDGQHLDRAEFHARYEAMPLGTRAELIGGVVSMPPMLGSDHGDVNMPVALWLSLYERGTPGVRGNINSSTVLDDQNEFQPDCSLRILTDHGGQTRTIPKWIEGAPELVVEIARSSRPVDLGRKLEEYRKAGVRDYVVVAIDPNEVFWHVQRGGQFVRIPPVEGGIYRSEAFPGLWLDPAALFRRDLIALSAAIERGLASPEHAAFVDELSRRRSRG